MKIIADSGFRYLYVCHHYSGSTLMDKGKSFKSCYWYDLYLDRTCIRTYTSNTPEYGWN